MASKSARKNSLETLSHISARCFVVGGANKNRTCDLILIRDERHKLTLQSAVEKRNVHGVNVAVVMQRSTGSWSTLDIAGHWTISEIGPRQTT